LKERQFSDRLGSTNTLTPKRRITMAKYVCKTCGYIFDEEKGDEEYGIAPGTKFDELPDDFECPLCGVGKDEFEIEE
jgi:rubredoxin